MNIHILGLDPGTTESALVLFDGERVIDKWLEANEVILDRLRYMEPRIHGCILAYEMIACYGMSVGAEVFETVLWTGRFLEAWGNKAERVYRKDVKLNLCHSLRANDANIAQALRDRFGQKGTKKNPGPMFGMKDDMWQALGVAVTAWDRIQTQVNEGVA